MKKQIKELERKRAGTAVFWIQNQRLCNLVPAVRQQGNNISLKTPQCCRQNRRIWLQNHQIYHSATTTCDKARRERDSYVQYLIFSQPHRFLLIYTNVNYCEWALILPAVCLIYHKSQSADTQHIKKINTFDNHYKLRSRHPFPGAGLIL